MAEYPKISPEAALEVANRHQEKYEQLAARRHTPTARGYARDEIDRLHHAVMTTNHLLFAVAGFLEQQHVCDHGVRGWCPSCHIALKEGTYPR